MLFQLYAKAPGSVLANLLPPLRLDLCYHVSYLAVLTRLPDFFILDVEPFIDVLPTRFHEPLFLVEIGWFNAQEVLELFPQGLTTVPLELGTHSPEFPQAR